MASPASSSAGDGAAALTALPAPATGSANATLSSRIAALRTFDIPEMLQMILEEADVRSVVNALRVDKTWRAAVEGAQAFQTKLFLVPQGTRDVDPDNLSSDGWEELYKMLAANPLLVPIYYKSAGGTDLELEISDAAELPFYVTLRFEESRGSISWQVVFPDKSDDDYEEGNSQQDPDLFTVDTKASYTKMYATSPACSAELIVRWPMTDEEKLCLERPALTYGSGRPRTTFQAKVNVAPATVGEVLRAVKVIIHNRPDVDDWEAEYPDEEEPEDLDEEPEYTGPPEIWKMQVDHSAFAPQGQATMHGDLEYKILRPFF